MLTRRLLASAAALAVAAAASAVVLVGGTAAADPILDCPPENPTCSIWDGEDGQIGGGGDGGDDGGSGSPGPGAPRVCKRGDVEVPCYDDIAGWFNSGDGCYYALAEPQPDGVPEGQLAYVQTCGQASTYAYLDAPPSGFEQRFSPEELAMQALAQITMNRPAIRIAPDPDGAGLVGLPVWMWIAPGPGQWGTQTASASDGPISVSLTATATRVVWSMGDGTSVTCRSLGTRYAAAYGAQPSPDCGHTYAKSSRGRSGGRYPVTATTTWEITWAGGGESGELTREFSSATSIRIDELQVVTR